MQGKQIYPFWLPIQTLLVCVLGCSVLCAQQALPGDGNPPLSTAYNSLSQQFAVKKPALQEGFKNPGDVWLLYSEDFDRLSGAAQSYLLRKYGILEFAAMGREHDKINDPALDLLSGTQSETSSATSGSNIVVGYNDASLSVYGSSISYSKDSGRTWKQTSSPLFPFGQGFGDPVIAVGPDGIFYHSYLAATGSGNSAVAVTRSVDGGASWTRPVNASAQITSGAAFHDKDWMTVDNSSSQFRGYIYVTWVRFTIERLQKSGIGLVRSSDGGKTWSLFKIIGKPNNDAGFVQGPMVATGPAGEVYVAYFDSRIPGIALVKSTDGGDNFSEPAVVIQDASLRTSKILSGGFATQPFPSIAVDNTDGPNRGAVYVTVNVTPARQNDESDVVLVKSADGGITWSKPLRVNDDETGTDQFQPSVAVARDGAVGVMWYDRRNDPTNNVLLDVYAAVSKDGGNNFLKNRRITPGSWILLPTPLDFRTNYHGDYNQISAGSLGLVFNWSDDESGIGSDISVAVLPPSDAAVAPPDFAFSGKIIAADVLAGSSTTFKLSSSRLNGFDGAITLEGNSTYPDFKFKFSSDELKSETEFTLTVDVPPSAPAGTYPLKVVGKGAGLTRTAGLRLTVHNAGETREAPRAISDIRTPLFQPKAVFDAAGTLHIVSFAGSNSSRLLYTQHRDGSQIASSTVFDIDGSSQVSNHAVGVDTAGKITVVWQMLNRVSRITDLFLSRSTDNGATFSAPVNLTHNTTERVSVLRPSMAVAKSGTIHLAFVQHDRNSGFRDVYYMATSDGGATLTPKVNVSNSGGKYPDFYGEFPSLVLDAAESVNVFYIYSTFDTFGDVYFSRSGDGAKFSTPTKISKTGSDLFIEAPSAAIDPAGNINVAFIQFDFFQDNPDIYLSRSTDGGANFSEPFLAVQLSSELGLMSAPPLLGVDNSGTLGIAFPALVSGPLFPGGRDVLFCKSIDGGMTFSPIINLSGNLGLERTNPLPVVNEAGLLTVLWEDETGGNSQIFLALP
ncbi:MAG TPA: sialidase family protein [Acidobacteriota bacterium]